MSGLGMSAWGVGLPHPASSNAVQKIAERNSLPPVVAARFIELLGEGGLPGGSALAFLRLLLQGDGLQAELVVLHCGGFKLQPRGQVSHFLCRSSGGQPAAQLAEPFRPRRDGGAHILGEAGIDADVAGVEVIGRAGLFRTGKAQLLEQIAIYRIGLGAARADNIEITVAEAFERAARYVEFAQGVGFELLR